MSMQLSAKELEFILEARRDGDPRMAALVNVTCFLERHHQEPSGLINLVDFAQLRELTVEQAEAVLKPRPDRRSIIYTCGDCDQVHDIYNRHCSHIDNQGHLLADNGGAILLDKNVRVVPHFKTDVYWSTRISQSVDMKFANLPEDLEPEVYLYFHLVCGQARTLGYQAWDSALAACNGKLLMKRVARRRRDVWSLRGTGADQGRPFRVCLLLHVDYGDGKKNTYAVRRRRITTLAMKYRLEHKRQVDEAAEAISRH